MHRASSPPKSHRLFSLKACKAANDEADNVYHHSPPPPPPPPPHPPHPRFRSRQHEKPSGALNSLKSLITCGKNPEKPENIHLAWGRERLRRSSIWIVLQIKVPFGSFYKGAVLLCVWLAVVVHDYTGTQDFDGTIIHESPSFVAKVEPFR